MPMTTTVAKKEKREDPTIKTINKVEYEPKNTAINKRPYESDNPYFRVIVGVHDNYGNINYVCYRKDRNRQFVVDSVNFNSDLELEDLRFIFDKNDFENLQDYLTQYDDQNLATIAQIGRKEIDPISLLPII